MIIPENTNTQPTVKHEKDTMHKKPQTFNDNSQRDKAEHERPKSDVHQRVISQPFMLLMFVGKPIIEVAILQQKSWTKIRAKQTETKTHPRSSRRNHAVTHPDGEARAEDGDDHDEREEDGEPATKEFLGENGHDEIR